MQKRSVGLLLAFAVIFWMWMDFVGLFLSVASTYFYFGWEGTPNLTIIIFCIALFSFSGPVWVRMLFHRNRETKLLPGLLSIQLLIYLGILLVRDSHIFAWGTVAGAFLSGVTAVVALRDSRLESHWMKPALGVLAGYIFFGLSRVLNVGMATIFVVSPLPLILLLLMAGGAIFFLWTGGDYPEEPEADAQAHKPMFVQLQAVAFGLLVGASVGLIYNLPVWNRAFGHGESSLNLFLLALGAAAVTGLGLWAALSQSRMGSLGLVILGTVLAGMGLKLVLAMPTSRVSALVVFYLSSTGLTILWGAYLRRLHLHLQQSDGELPILGLQIGFVLFLFVLLFLLLFSNPNGFWVALGLSALLLLVLEVTGEDVQNRVPMLPYYIVGLVFLFAVPAFLSLFSKGVSNKPVKPLSKAPKFTVMTANVRYGWTDDYRFQPKPLLNWLKKHPADIVGFQEFNRGHTSASYMDLFLFYSYSMPGTWHYADANYGFGNALRSRFPVLSAKLMNYDAKDMLRRSCLKTVINVHGQKINVMVTHLSHHYHPNKIRQAQVKQLISWVQKNKRPWILMGDMNAEPKHPEIKWLKKASHPLFTKRAKELFAAKTHPAKGPKIRIDYIFFSRHFNLHKMEVLDPGVATDHRPVRAVLSLRKTPVKAASKTTPKAPAKAKAPAKPAARKKDADADKDAP